MNIKQVRYVCAIVDLGSFSAAAAREGVSVQAVSKAMAELEAALGEPLFERRSAGVTPTPLGRAFAARARRVLDEWSALERYASSPVARVAQDDPLRVGFCCPVYDGVDRLVRLISTVMGKVLGRRAEVEMLRCSEATDALSSGRSEALITLEPLSSEDVASVALGTVSSGVVLPDGHPLADRGELTLDEIGAYPVLYPVGFEHFSRAVVDAYRQRGLRSELVEVASLDDVGDLYASRCGYSFIAAGNITGVPEGFVLRQLRAADTLPVPIYLSFLRGPGSVDFLGFRRALSQMGLVS